ncbi:MAG: hypothetical protein JNL43_13155 [Flavobacteriales bacterium]|nr:hypothetical protein [Flavobacteriales bacterium]HRH70247.1 hypothetical protein [Flavobacteriales bacterium]
MENRNTPQLKSGLVALVLLVSATTHAASPPARIVASEAVELTGWLHTEDFTVHETTVEVEVNGVTEVAPVTLNGRFHIELPADAEVRLRFEKEGHLSKEVIVDTRHAQVGDAGQHIRHVKCAVIMELERRMGGLTYAGPVGSLAFDPEGGCLAVTHDRKLVPAKPKHRKAAMEF